MLGLTRQAVLGEEIKDVWTLIRAMCRSPSRTTYVALVTVEEPRVMKPGRRPLTVGSTASQHRLVQPGPVIIGLRIGQLPERGNPWDSLGPKSAQDGIVASRPL